MKKGGYIYIVSNKSRSVFYTGVTSNLRVRSHQHKTNEGSAFTKKYQCTDLIYYEFFDYIVDAIKREKQLKKWRRAWKEKLIRSINPGLQDLYDQADELS